MSAFLILPIVVSFISSPVGTNPYIKEIGYYGLQITSQEKHICKRKSYQMKAKFFKILAIILPLFTSCGKPSVSPVPFSWPFDPDASYRAITDEMAKIENFIKEAEKEESKLYVKYIHDEYHTEYIDNENLFVTELKDIEFQPLDPEYVHEWATDKTSFTVSFIYNE